MSRSGIPETETVGCELARRWIQVNTAATTRNDDDVGGGDERDDDDDDEHARVDDTGPDAGVSGSAEVYYRLLTL